MLGASVCPLALVCQAAARAFCEAAQGQGGTRLLVRRPPRICPLTGRTPLYRQALTLAMSRDGSSGGVVRLVTVAKGRVESQMIAPEEQARGGGTLGRLEEGSRDERIAQRTA